MIQANELRIGNWVIDDEGYKGKVACLTSDKKNKWEDEDEKFIIEFDGDDSIYESNYFNPIPLTPEILEKCANVVTDEGAGFEAKYYRFCLNKEGDGLYLRKYYDGGFIWGLSSETAEFEVGVPKPIKSLHHLQNIIHSLTGQELIINL